MNNKSVYFASPWFNADQAEREARVKNKLKELGFNVWSPKDNCECPPNASQEMRKATFSENCMNIISSDIIFAITDGKDMGTIWEAGFAYGYNCLNKAHGNKSKKIVYYCETLGDGKFNLMLAQSGDIIITKFEDLDKLPKLIKRNEGLAYAGVIE